MNRPMTHDEREAHGAVLDALPQVARINGTAQQLPPDSEDDAPLPPLRAYDVHELAGMIFKPRDVLLAPWLHTQDLCMVFAGRGIGKTHFGLAVSYAVSTAGRFTRWQAPTARKVLYLDGELPGGVMQKRLLMHCPTPEPAPGFFRVFTPDLVPDGRTLPDLATWEGQALIDQMIEPDTALVVVDNLSAWARSGRENEAESWHPVAEWILALRRRGIAVLLIHHAGKGGQQRGTSKREDLLDVVIGLSRPQDYDPQKGAVFVVDFTKARNLMGEDAESLGVAFAEPLPVRDRDRQALDRDVVIGRHRRCRVIAPGAPSDRRKELAIEHRVVDPARVPDVGDVVAVKDEVERGSVIEVWMREHEVIDPLALGRLRRPRLDA